MDTQVHIEHQENAKYPEWDARVVYGPDTRYPEFGEQFGDIPLACDNSVYTMVRNTLLALGLDEAHAGTENWNPFADFINAGETVLIKPNMVFHKNGDERYGTDCLVTHPSIVRVVLDYVLLATNGRGRIILADAPVQGCDFSTLVKNLHYEELVAYYQRLGYEVSLYDLRQLDDAYIKNQNDRKYTVANKDVVVSMGEESAFFEEREEWNGNLRITNYLPKYMQQFHAEGKHDYSLAQLVLEADVIINLPKPKTHRKAGMTASLKNMIGCVAKKECLPHHTKGSKKEGGDEYLKKSFFKKWKTSLMEKRDENVAKGKTKNTFNDWFRIFLYKAAKATKADDYSEGSWYGNDTLWRTITDMCRMILYADSKGILQEKTQRKMFILADMIVAGEGEGPLLPMPHPMGILVAGHEQIAVDNVIAALMGYDAEWFPSIAKAGYGKKYILPQSRFWISSNDSALNEKEKEEIRTQKSPFIPPSGWTDYLEEKIKT